MKKFWNDRYAAEEFVYGKEPNEFFKSELSNLQPGKLLLPCEGEGRNAVFAARQKWKVDAFDQSEKGKEKCLALANQYKVTVNYTIADALEIEMGENKYDMIALIFAHFPSAIRKQFHQKCINALKPGGLLLLEAFNPLQLNNESGGPKDPDMLYTTAILRDDFGNLNFKYLQELKVNLSEGKHHEGKADVIRLLATK
ncbi:MAG: methyltransferase domain-containing protein [Bacteroidota bacterium]|nr:methyltransferase domain-containing protein [Bacteroidota bacterium]